MRTTDPVIRDLRKQLGKVNVGKGMHLGGQTVGDRFIEYGYAYRIS